MSLKEIQVRRKRLGLQPLYMNSSPQIYLALKYKTGFETDQTWYFEALCRFVWNRPASSC